MLQASNGNYLLNTDNGWIPAPEAVDAITEAADRSSSSSRSRASMIRTLSAETVIQVAVQLGIEGTAQTLLTT